MEHGVGTEDPDSPVTTDHMAIGDWTEQKEIPVTAASTRRAEEAMTEKRADTVRPVTSDDTEQMVRKVHPVTMDREAGRDRQVTWVRGVSPETLCTDHKDLPANRDHRETEARPAATRTWTVAGSWTFSRAQKATPEDAEIPDSKAK